jgi:hypothetical protein
MIDEQKLDELNGITAPVHKYLLSDAQKIMLEMALADAAAGRCINADTLHELDETWLQKA